ncbi:hypothetical protein BKA69DRAFT_143312 [Paraphysoderma sedebokerense]|nr:hypothetical protein BKA69DRAFT_143312 [Paraphysoderma sedebokerense]
MSKQSRNSDPGKQLSSNARMDKKDLSSKVMTMKFMQRAEDRVLAQKAEEEQIQKEKEAKWVAKWGLKIEQPKYKIEYDSSYLSFLDLPGTAPTTSSMSAIPGRRSFGGFSSKSTVSDPAIESRVDSLLSTLGKRKDRDDDSPPKNAPKRFHTSMEERSKKEEREGSSKTSSKEKLKNNHGGQQGSEKSQSEGNKSNQSVEERKKWFTGKFLKPVD